MLNCLEVAIIQKYADDSAAIERYNHIRETFRNIVYGEAIESRDLLFDDDFDTVDYPFPTLREQPLG